MTLSKQALFKRLMNEAGDEGSDTGGTEIAQAKEGPDVATESPDGEEASDEVTITIGDEAPETAPEDESSAVPWVRNMRKQNRELQKELRDLKAKAAQPTGVEAAPTVGAKPTLEGCDFDSDAYEQKLDAWHDSKRKADEHAAKVSKERETQDAEWNGKLANYAEQKKALKVADYDSAEAVALESLSITQQGIILQGATDPAKLVYVIGNNPTKAKELSGIKDPVQFAFAVARLETQLKTTPKTTPPVERKLGGSSAGGSGDSIKDNLERLREKAAKTNDYTEVRAFRKKHNV
jgi:hypothetical protein